jgi:hypothetical protein
LGTIHVTDLRQTDLPQSYCHKEKMPTYLEMRISHFFGHGPHLSPHFMYNKTNFGIGPFL